MTKNNQLDSRYHCTQDSSKTQLIKCINAFINQEPLWKPENHSNSLTTIKEFCVNNKLQHLEITLFATKLPHELYDPINGKIIFIALNEKNQKKIFLKRSKYSPIQEMNSKLSKDTLWLIYEKFVQKIISYKHIFQEWKRIPSLINLIREKTFLLQTPHNSNIMLQRVTKIVVSKSNTSITIFSNHHVIDKTTLKLLYISPNHIAQFTWRDFINLCNKSCIGDWNEINEQLHLHIQENYKIATNNINILDGKFSLYVKENKSES